MAILKVSLVNNIYINICFGSIEPCNFSNGWRDVLFWMGDLRLSDRWLCRIPCSGIWRRAVWWKFTTFSGNCLYRQGTRYFLYLQLYLEKRDRIFLRNVGKPVWEYMAPHSRRQQSSMYDAESIRNTTSVKSLKRPTPTYVPHSFIAHETAICRNPPRHNFTGDRKNLTDP
jgi:hypothetical protein